MKLFRVFLWAGLVLAYMTGISGCSTADKASDTAEDAYALAQEFDKEERYDEAIRRYQEVKNKFPYSKLAVTSELAIADAYYKQESFAEAQVSYQSFKDLHPKHSQVDYVVYKLGMSYFKQLPSTIDRDLSLAPQASAVFAELISNYPQSEYVKDAKERRDETRKMLASKEDYIADFYYKRGKYDSALARYQGLLATYPGLGFDEKARERIAVCEQKKKEDQH